MSVSAATRGFGLLENTLAGMRARMVLRLLTRANVARDRILDIGCGHEPLFLSEAPFREKVGIDQQVTPQQIEQWKQNGIQLIRQDMEVENALPFPDGHFDAVTMLAVFEHIALPNLEQVLKEIHRILRPGGCYVVTTPAHWTDPILWGLSRMRLLSKEEVEEHEETHSHASIQELLLKAGFSTENIEQGTFEWGMNLWGCARKS